MSIQPSNTSSSDKVPELRFPGFFENWNQKRFEELYSFKTTNSYSRENLNYENGTVKNIDYGDIHTKFNSLFDVTKELVPYINEEIDFSRINEESYLQEGDLIIADASEDYNDIGKTIEVKNLNNEKVVAGLHTFLARKESNEIVIGFTSFLMKTRKVRLAVMKIAQGTKVLGISTKRLAKIPLFIPQREEQQKIASFLTAIDQRIQLLQQKKANLEEYKKGVMQKLFSQEIRFKIEGPDGDLVEPPDWEEKRLGEVLFEHKKKNKGNLFDEVFSVSKEKGVINQIEHLGRSYSADSIEHYKLINPFDIVYTKSPTSDFPFGIIKQNLTERTGVLSPLYAVFQPKNKWVGFILHSYFLSWVNTYNYLVPLVHRGAKNTMNINNNDFLKGSKISLPTSEAEQQKIASFLSSIDKSISIVQKEIDGMTTFKKGLLQKMFV